MLKNIKYTFISASMCSSHYKIIKEVQLDQADNHCIKNQYVLRSHLQATKLSLVIYDNITKTS